MILVNLGDGGSGEGWEEGDAGGGRQARDRGEAGGRQGGSRGRGRGVSKELLYGWRFFCYSAPIHWLVMFTCHLTLSCLPPDVISVSHLATMRKL